MFRSLEFIDLFHIQHLTHFSQWPLDVGGADEPHTGLLWFPKSHRLWMAEPALSLLHFLWFTCQQNVLIIHWHAMIIQVNKTHTHIFATWMYAYQNVYVCKIINQGKWKASKIFLIIYRSLLVYHVMGKITHIWKARVG